MELKIKNALGKWHKDCPTSRSGQMKGTEGSLLHTLQLYPSAVSVSCPGLCVGGTALSSWLQLALEPVHQHWPAEHLLPSPADKLNFSSKPKDNTEATFSCLLFLHKYFLTQDLEEYFSLNCMIWQTT